MTASSQPSTRPDSRNADPASTVSSHDSVANKEGLSEPVTPEEEDRLVRKLDFLLLPPLTILYLLSFLDRSNIGNAKLDGLVADIGLGTNYNTALTIFFVGYVIAELPSNWGLKLTKPPLWLPLATFLFGLFSIAQGLCVNASSFLAIRFFLGIFESVLFPGTVFIFSQYYKRKERVVRVSYYFASAAAAGAFGGILAFALGEIKTPVRGNVGWPWIFIIEGVITCVIALITVFTIPTWPNKTQSLNSRELHVLRHRLQHDSDALEAEDFNWSGVRQAVTDPHVWLYCLLFHGNSFPLYTISLFLPSIISEVGYASWQAQLLSVPPYVLAFLFTLFVAWANQRTGIKAPWILGCFSLSILGYIVQITSPTAGGKYVATFLTVAGVYAATSTLLSWPAENIAGATKRNTAMAMVIMLGNLGAVIGTQVYRIPLGDVPNKNYVVSHGLSIAWCLVGIIACLSLWFLLARQNRKRDALAAGVGPVFNPMKGKQNLEEKGSVEVAEMDEEKRQKEIQQWRDLGDYRPEWRYQL